MIRTIFTIGLFAVLGLFLLKIVFGILAFSLGLFFVLARAAFVVGVVLLALYVVLRIVSPDTARRISDRWSGRSI